MPHDHAAADATLRHALHTYDPAPEHLRAVAQAAFRAHPPTGEVAELVVDSALPRGPREDSPRRPVRTLEFRHEGFAVHLAAEPNGGLLRLLVHTMPHDVHVLTVLRPHGSHTVRAPAHGPLPLQVPPGPLSLLCLRRDGTTVATSWTLL